jgi:hypothetical protein
MVNTKLMEAWFRLMAEAARGTAEAQEALKSLSRISGPEDFANWMARLLPVASREASLAPADDWLEEWWRMIGFVPRYRYLELLDRCDSLRRKLEEAEATIARLRAMSSVRVANPGEPTHSLMGAWEGMFQEMLKAQAGWAEAWAAQQKAQATQAAQESADPSAQNND